METPKDQLGKLKKTRAELDKMDEDGITKLLEARWGKEKAQALMTLGFGDFAKNTLGNMLDREIKQLEGKP